MDKLDVWKEKLKEKNIRWTKQRTLIFELLLDSEEPLSAKEIFSELEAKGVELRLSTVYRNLNFFAEQEILEVFNFNTQEKKFELITGEHHHHLLCLGCEEVIALECPLEGYSDKLSSETNYQISKHRLKVYGICPSCRDDKA